MVTHVTTREGGALGGEKGISKVKAKVGAGATAERSVKYKIPIRLGPRAGWAQFVKVPSYKSQEGPEMFETHPVLGNTTKLFKMSSGS